MKSLITGFCFLFVSLLVSAHPNPQYRICSDHQAEFVVADIPFDQIGLCKVGSSYIGAIDLMQYFWENTNPLSVQNYIAGNTSCPRYEVISYPLEGGVHTLCIFEDGSVMDSISLKYGRYDFGNSFLNQLLGL